MTAKSGKLTIWIKLTFNSSYSNLFFLFRKLKKDDNWFSLYWQKTIGGNDSD